jgi:hypothetical protein
MPASEHKQVAYIRCNSKFRGARWLAVARWSLSTDRVILCDGTYQSLMVSKDEQRDPLDLLDMKFAIKMSKNEHNFTPLVISIARYEILVHFPSNASMMLLTNE